MAGTARTSELVSGGEGQAGAGRGGTVQELVYAVARVRPDQGEPTEWPGAVQFSDFGAINKEPILIT